MPNQTHLWRPAFMNASMAMMLGCILIGIVTLINESNFRARNLDGSSDIQSLIKTAICGVLGLYGLFHIWQLDWANKSPFSLLMLGYCVTSFVCCSNAINKTFSIASCLTLTSVVLFAFASMHVLGRRWIVQLGLVFTTIFLVACIAAHAVAPELNGFDSLTSNEASEARLAGLAHPNGTGRIAAFALALALIAWELRCVSPWMVGAVVVLAMVTLLATGSRTWLIASIAMTGVFCWFTMPMSMSLPLCGSLAVVVFASLTLAASNLLSTQLDQGLEYASRSGKSSEVYSMTGRVPLWAFCGKKFLESPIQGFGHGCQRFVIEDHYWKTQHAHNIFLNAAIGTGAVGASILVFIFLRQFYLAVVSPCLFPDAMLTLFLIGGMTENPILNPIPGISTLLFVWALIWRDRTSLRPFRSSSNMTTIPIKGAAS